VFLSEQGCGADTEEFSIGLKELTVYISKPSVTV